MIEGSAAVRVGDSGPRPVHLLFSEPARPFGDDPTLDSLVRARGQWVSIETLVRTWDGDGLDAFLSSLAEDFRGWEGARAWRSLELNLTISAEHRPGGYVHLTWASTTGLRPRSGTSRPLPCMRPARRCESSPLSSTHFSRVRSSSYTTT